jgi:hypothetical protein
MTKLLRRNFVTRSLSALVASIIGTRLEAVSAVQPDQLAEFGCTVKCMILDAMKMFIDAHGNVVPRTIHVTRPMAEALTAHMRAEGLGCADTWQKERRLFGREVVLDAVDFKLENKIDIPARGNWPNCLVNDLLPHEAFWAGDDYSSYASRFVALNKGRWFWFNGNCFRTSRKTLEYLAKEYGVKMRLTDLQPGQPEYVAMRVELLGPADPRFERAAFDEKFERPDQEVFHQSGDRYGMRLERSTASNGKQGLPAGKTREASQPGSTAAEGTDPG